VDARTVLLIAGSNAASKASHEALESAGMNVLRATDGLTGMRDALGERPDAVVLDFAADEAADVMRARRALREAGIPLVVLVDGHIDAAAEPDDPVGITFLRSPADPAVLVSEVTRAVEAAAPAKKSIDDEDARRD
jgi:DNA-binding NtrC family response regulator